MCVGISKSNVESYGKELFAPFAYTTFNDLNEFCNVKADGLEAMARRVVGALGYLALMVAIEVEAAFRLALGLIALLPCFAITLVRCRDDLLEISFLLMIGALFSIVDAPARAISALVQNALLGRGLDFDDIKLCHS
ncbi:MAG: hypothetical protein HYX48_02470 [Chlamydiales bacterium]|nr:hypothetical protein [Chlamydiales bacterium]